MHASRSDPLSIRRKLLFSALLAGAVAAGAVLADATSHGALLGAARNAARSVRNAVGLGPATPAPLPGLTGVVAPQATAPDEAVPVFPYRTRSCGWLEEVYGAPLDPAVFDECNRRRLHAGEARLQDGVWIHGQELADAKPGGEIRVGVFGGSSVEGYVELEQGRADSFPKRMEERLGAPYRVLNFGMGGGNSRVALWQLEHMAPRWELDVAILYTGANDVRACRYFDRDTEATIERFLLTGDDGRLGEIDAWFAANRAGWARERERTRHIVAEEAARLGAALVPLTSGVSDVAALGERIQALTGLPPHSAFVTEPALLLDALEAEGGLAAAALADMEVQRALKVGITESRRVARLRRLLEMQDEARTDVDPAAVASSMWSSLGRVRGTAFERGETLTNIRAFVDVARAAGVQPVLVAPPYGYRHWPVGHPSCFNYLLGPVEQAAVMESLADAIRALARDEGLPVVDAREVLGNPERAASMYGDVVHLDRPGLQAMAEHLAEVIRPSRAPAL